MYHSVGSPDVGCTVEDTEGRNLLGVEVGVGELADCRRLCEEKAECEYFTWYSQEAELTSHLCYLFSDCPTVSPCADCVTQRKDSCYCGAPVTASLADSLAVVPYTPTELTCRDLCRDTTDCTFYTWRSEDWLCFLQSSLTGSLQPCQNCLTGPVDCTDFQLCRIYVGESEGNSFKFEDTDSNERVNLVALGLAPCELRVLGVGGGGPGYSQLSDGGYSGGGGSGNIFYSTFSLTSGSFLSLSLANKVRGR